MIATVCVTVIALVLGCSGQGLFSEEEKRARDTIIDDHLLQNTPDKIAVPLLKGKCCPSPNGMSINLAQGTVAGSVAGVSTPVIKPQTTTEAKCSYMAELRANFRNLTGCLYDWHQKGCVSFPMCGRRMLRIDMFLGNERKGYMFNVGDSPSNNGWGGDSGHTQNDAEIFGYYPNMYGYKSDLCNTQKTAWANKLLAPGVKRVTIFVSNNYARITNNQGFEVKGCDKCGFALNGQDPNDLANTLYMSFNKVIQKFSSRRGVGVCNVRIRWECPDCERLSILPLSLDVKSADSD